MAIEGYFFEDQIAKFILQFMLVFEGLQYKTGKREDGNEHMYDVPIVYGSRDRVTASILAENTQNAAIRLPTMAAYMQALTIAPDRMKGTGIVRRETFLPRGGMLPDDIQTVKQPMPVPFDTTMQLSIYSSNMLQHRQILEQILVYFDPLVQIQKNDEEFDWTKISVVELQDINFDENYPAGIDKRAIISTLTFKMPIWIGVPASLKKSFVQRIYTRLIAVNHDDSLADIIADLPGILDPYDLLISGDIPPITIGGCDEDN